MLVAAIKSWALAAVGLVVGIFDRRLHREGWALFALGFVIGNVFFIRLETRKRQRR